MPFLYGSTRFFLASFILSFAIIASQDTTLLSAHSMLRVLILADFANDTLVCGRDHGVRGDGDDGHGDGGHCDGGHGDGDGCCGGSGRGYGGHGHGGRVDFGHRHGWRFDFGHGLGYGMLPPKYRQLLPPQSDADQTY